MLKRRFGKSDLQVSALGIGCWAIGGPYWRTDGTNRIAMGWGSTINDDESIRAIHRALDLGVNFIDTANNYGAGHSEQVVGKALAGRRGEVILATKFGSVFDEEQKLHFDNGEFKATPEFLREACEASLRRLNTDYIDLYQLHRGSEPIEIALQVRDLLEDLVKEGKIRWYGWSTDDPERAQAFADGAVHCTAIQHRINLFNHAEEMLKVCDKFDLASINKSPLASGILTGKFSKDSKITDDQDGRMGVDFSQGRMAAVLDKLDELRDILTEDGRTLTQGALGWIWAHHPRTIPIPGFKTVQQIEENVGAAQFGALNEDQMTRIAALNDLVNK